MKFNKHYNLEGKHAFLSGSNHYWTNYTVEKLQTVYNNMKSKEEGTYLHNFASMAVLKKIKVARLKKALNLFINDAIGFGMQSEQVLYYSDNCFGTTDAILFKDGLLRIHDLKTGTTKTSFKQLDIYAALFCLEYRKDPHDIVIEERIYQGSGYTVNVPDAQYISDLMTIIVEFDIVIENMKTEG